MTTVPARQPQGQPTGGQFAATAHQEAAVSLVGADARPAETQRARRGHDFYPPAAEMATWPDLYATDRVPPAEKKVLAHYFQGPADWYIVEYDPKANEAFGYADLGLGHPEWGYIDLGEVEQLRGQMGLPIERDLDFEPGTPASKCIPRYVADAAAAGDKDAMEALQDQAVAAIVRDVMAERAVEGAAAAGAERDALASDLPDDYIDFGWDGPDAEDPMTPEQRQQYDFYHRFAYNYGHECLGLRNFEDRDKVELFAGFAAEMYVEAGNENMDIHYVVDQWDEKLTNDAMKQPQQPSKRS